MEPAVLWHLNRGTGIALLVLFTLSAVLGIVSSRSSAGSRVPAFAWQRLHRNVALVGAALLATHVATAAIDEYVDIRWWQSVMPVSLDYEPLPLAMGILSLDLLIAVVVTSLVRHRLPRRAWASIHLSGYAALALSFAHGLLIGTDTEAGWARWVYVGCATALAVAVLGRALLRRASRAHGLTGLQGAR